MPLSISRRALAAAALAAAMAGLARAEPQVQSLTCSPGIIDVRAQDVIVTCALRVLDKDADLDFAYTRLVSPSGKFSLPLFFDGKKSIGIASFTGCVGISMCICIYVYIRAAGMHRPSADPTLSYLSASVTPPRTINHSTNLAAQVTIPRHAEPGYWQVRTSKRQSKHTHTWKEPTLVCVADAYRWAQLFNHDQPPI